MRVAVIGAGPAGLLAGAGLSRRGHEVVVIDRDAGPGGPGPWRRRGVMQFDHAHAFRFQVAEVLAAEWPDALSCWVARGAEPVTVELPGRGVVLAGHRSRRETFERALRAAATDVRALTVRHGHVDGVMCEGGAVRGLVVDGSRLDADLVVDASGRAGRALDRVRAPATVGGPCGVAYVDRQYRLHEGAEPGPMLGPLAWVGDFDGFQVLVFPHEHGYFSVVVLRPAMDTELKALRHDAAFDVACLAIPGLAVWTDPARAAPVTGVLAGGALRNAYRGQAAADGRPVVPGLVSVGDAVATTTPNFGRGVATTFLQVQQLLALLDDERDPTAATQRFDAWCEENMLPWVLDHVAADGDQVRRWQGGDVDISRRLPSPLVLAAAAVDPRIGAAAGGYTAMIEPPACLDPVEPLAREVFASGWRPPYSPGPTRDELVEIIDASSRRQPTGAGRAGSGRSPDVRPAVT